MSVDSFTTPAEAEREARIKQAHDMLAYAAHDHHFYNPYLDDDLPAVVHERHAASVLYASQAATAHAMLAVRDELADIAASLRTLAADGAALGQIAEGVTQLGDVACDVHTAVEFYGGTATDVLSNIATEALDRPRWWQFRLRRALRRAATGSEVSE